MAFRAPIQRQEVWTLRYVAIGLEPNVTNLGLGVPTYSSCYIHVLLCAEGAAVGNSTGTGLAGTDALEIKAEAHTIPDYNGPHIDNTCLQRGPSRRTVINRSNPTTTFKIMTARRMKAMTIMIMRIRAFQAGIV